MKRKWIGITTILILLCMLGIGLRLTQPLRSSRALCGKPLLEDSYYAFTIARNIAMGHGITYNGKVWTNGFQPAIVFVQAVIYKAVGKDKMGGVRGVLVFQAILSLVTALLIWKATNTIQKKIFYERPEGVPGWNAGSIGAALWLGSYSIFIQDMNGLETGLYFFVLALLFLSSIRIGENISQARILWQDYVILMVVGSCCMYVRNDAFFLLIPIYITFFFISIKSHCVAKVIFALFFSGIGMILMFTPWMMYNLQIGGSIIPISGPAESVMAKDYSLNVKYMISAILDYFFVGLETPISDIWFGFWGPFVVRIIPIIGIILFLLIFRKQALVFCTKQSRRGMVVFAVSFAFLCGWSLLVVYYTHEFFAWWMFRRYFCPVYVLWVPWVSIYIYQLLKYKHGANIVLVLLSIYLVGLMVYMTDLFTTKRVVPMYHFVEFCEKNLPQDTSVAAWQTGVLGYFWDNTINLDGKVNPEIQQFREQGKNTYEYIAERYPDVIIEYWGHRVCREPETKKLYVQGPKRYDHTGETRINYEVAYSKSFYSQNNKDD